MDARDEAGTAPSHDRRRDPPDAPRAGLLRALRPAPLLVLAGLGLLPLQAAEGETPAVGEEPPRLALRSLEGEPRSLEDLRGRIVVLNFWATWCIPCREEMPILVKAKERYGRRGVEIVGASADDPGDLDKVRSFRREQGLNFPVWTGATIPDMTALGLGEALPATAILDLEGRVAFRIRGPVTPAQLTSRLDFLLEPEGSEPPARTLDTFAAHAAGGPGDGAGAPAGEAAGSRKEEAADHRHDHGEGGDHHHGGGEGDASLVPS